MAVLCVLHVEKRPRGEEALETSRSSVHRPDRDKGYAHIGAKEEKIPADPKVELGYQIKHSQTSTEKDIKADTHEYIREKQAHLYQQKQPL